MSIGALSRQEIESEFKFLHPMTNMMASAMMKAIGKKTQQLLANEDYVNEMKKQMYFPNKYTEQSERTWINDMDPSFQRVKQYKTKTCKDGID
jgi:hypothetical protein